jgi:O-antigen ligase
MSLLFDLANANAALFVMFGALVSQLTLIWPDIKNDRLARVSIIFLIYLSLTTLVSLLRSPSISHTIITSSVHWAYTGFLAIFIVSFWLVVMSPPRLSQLLFLSLSGFFLRILYRLEWEEIWNQLAALWEGSERATFGNAATIFGLWSSVGLLGLMILAPRLWGSQDNRCIFAVRILFWFILCGILLESLIFSQTRTIWLVSIVVFPVCISILLYVNIKHKKDIMHIMLLTVFILCFFIFCFLNKDIIIPRMSAEKQTIADLFSGNFQNIPQKSPSSIGCRLYMAKVFWDNFKKRPLVGWGPGLSGKLIDQSNYAFLQKYERLHNSYFEILIQFGILGSLLFGYMFWLIFSALWNGLRSKFLDLDVFLFLVGAWALLGLGCFTLQPIQSYYGPFFLALLGGASYAYSIKDINLRCHISDSLTHVFMFIVFAYVQIDYIFF